MNIEDTYGIVASFLQPLELVISGRLSKTHSIWFIRYVRRKYGSKSLQDLVCPICASWLDTDDEIFYTDFKNVYTNTDQEERQRYGVVKSVLNYKPYSRRKLLCDECEYNELEINIVKYPKNFMPVNGSPQLRKIFYYRGDREYTIFIKNSPVISWAFLFLELPNEYYWNEIDIIIPYIETNQQYYQDFLMDYS